MAGGMGQSQDGHAWVDQPVLEGKQFLIDVAFEHLPPVPYSLWEYAKGKTPQKWSLLPSTQHPHARPQPPKQKSRNKHGVLACPRATPAALDSHRRRQPPGDVPARRMSAWRGEAFGQRPGAAAAPAKGAARDHRFPAVSEPIVTED